MSRQQQMMSGSLAPRGSDADGRAECSPKSDGKTAGTRIAHRPGCLFYLGVTNFVLLTVASILYNVGLKVAAYAIGWPLVVLMPAFGIAVWVSVGWAGLRVAREVDRRRAEEREGADERAAGPPGAPWG